MRDETLILTLAKVLIASAWADGELTNDEVNCIKDLMFNLPGQSLEQMRQDLLDADAIGLDHLGFYHLVMF